MSKNMRFLPFLIIFSLVGVCMEIDISVPSFPDMVVYYHANVQTVQNTLTFNFIGICISGLLYGPLSDCFGRRKIMLIGGFLFMVGSVICTFAPTIEVMIAARFTQGIGASALLIVVYAIMADAYEGEMLTKFMGIMNATVTAFMAIAPVIGGFVNEYFGWRANFQVVAFLSALTFLGIWILLPETLPIRKRFHWGEVLGDYKRLLSNTTFNIYALLGSAYLAVYLLYVACAPFLYVDAMGLSLKVYAVNQAIIIAAFSGTSLIVGRLQKAWGLKRMIILGVCAQGVAATGLLVMAALDVLAPLPLTCCMCFHSLGNALLFNLAIVFSMELFPELKGAVAAMLASIRLLGTAVVLFVTGMFFGEGKLLPLALSVAVVIVFSTMLSALVYGPIRRVRTLA